MSQINVDKISGKSTYGSISVVAEGNTVTTNLQSGLSKAWWQYDQTNDETDGSCNVSSISDDGTGLYKVTMSNIQSSITDRSVQLTSNHESGDGNGRSSCVRHDNSGSFTTSAITVEVFYNDNYNLADNNHNFGTVYGDLA